VAAWNPFLLFFCNYSASIHQDVILNSSLFFRYPFVHLFVLAIGGVTGVINEFTFGLAGWALFRGALRLHRIAAMGAFKACHGFLLFS
jgi:hypothetical protein